MSFVRSQSGPGGALAQEMTIENNSINTLNKEQDNLQTRLNKIQDNYIAQYSGLNALLFQLNSTSTNLGNALTALNNMSASN
jgi:flagellar capping protein FliD